MMDPVIFRAAILEKLATVIDPETGVDVVHMRLIEDLVVDESGHVSYKFRPSSAFCPIAVPLANAIQLAVAEVPGVTSQEVQIVGYAFGEEMAALLRQVMDEKFRQIQEGQGEEPPQERR